MVNSPAQPVPSVVPPLPSTATTPPLPAVVHSDTVFHCRAVVAQTITPNDFPRLTSLVRNLAPDTGSVRELGDGLLWEQDSGYSALSLTINPEPDGTVVRADLRLDGQRAMYYVGAIGTGIMSGLVATTMIPLLPSLGVGVAMLVPAIAIARRLWVLGARRNVERLHALVGQVAAGIRGDLE